MECSVLRTSHPHKPHHFTFRSGVREKPSCNYRSYSSPIFNDGSPKLRASVTYYVANWNETRARKLLSTELTLLGVALGQFLGGCRAVAFGSQI